MSKITRNAGVALSVILLHTMTSLAQPPGGAGTQIRIDDDNARSYMKTIWNARVTEDEVHFDLAKWASGRVPTLGLGPSKLPEPFGDKHLEILGKIQGLRKITLLDTFVVGPGLARMANRDQITNITIKGILDDTGAQELAKFAKLEVVDLTSTRVTPKGIDELLNNKTLKTVSVDMSDAMIDLFANRSRLDLLTFKNSFGRATLRLVSREVSDKSLSKIKNQSGIEYLVLENTAVTDASAANISRLKSYLLPRGMNVECMLDPIRQSFTLEWLFQYVQRPVFRGPHGVGHVCMAREDQNRDRRCACPKDFLQLKAIHARHANCRGAM